MTTDEKIEKRIGDIRERAPAVGRQVLAQAAAIGDEFRARQELLMAALQAALPAWPMLVSRLPVQVSRRGCAEHQLKPGTDVRGKLEGVRLLPNVAVNRVDDEWLFYFDQDPFYPGRCGCFRYEWRPISVDVLLREASLADMVEGLAQAIEEQLAGAREKRSLQFKARAQRLRAVALLVGDAPR